MGILAFLKNKPPEDYYADRVKDSYRLDSTRFPEIFASLDQAIKKAKEEHPYPEESKLAVLFTLNQKAIMIKGDYITNNSKEQVFFDYLGRLKGDPRKYGGLVLETFSPPENCPATAKPSLDLIDALREYII